MRMPIGHSEEFHSAPIKIPEKVCQILYGHAGQTTKEKAANSALGSKYFHHNPPALVMRGIKTPAATCGFKIRKMGSSPLNKVRPSRASHSVWPLRNNQ